MKYLILLCFLIATVNANPLQTFGLKDCCESYCYSTDIRQPQRHEFGSKTAYQWAKGSNVDFSIPGCTPNKLWMFIRHGTRFPEEEEIDEVDFAKEVHEGFLKNYKGGKQPKEGALCTDDERLLESWRWDESITKDKAEWLTEQGFEDLYGLGQTYRSLIQQFVDLRYDPSVFEFRHTDTQRTNASFRGFFEGLFGRGSSSNLESPQVSVPDPLINPYDVCVPYQARRDDKKQRQLFEDMEDFRKMMADVSTKLGFSSPLKKGRINSIWDLCRYEQAWYLNRLSPWCTAFTYSQNQILHYREDLKQWYKAGYAYPDNQYLMCTAVKDMVNRLKTPDGPPVTAYVGHSTGIYLLINALGWFKDETPLLASNFRQQANRKWFISNIAPFASNIAITRYGCSDGVDRIKILFKEKPIDLPWCPNGVCTVDDLVEEYKLFVNANCDQIYCR